MIGIKRQRLGRCWLARRRGHENLIGLRDGFDRQGPTIWLRKILASLTLLILVVSQVMADEHHREPETLKPWDLVALSQPPQFTWIERSGNIRSLLFAGEPFQERPTRVFAYYASPDTISGDDAPDRRFPGIVLVHGGGGTAFREWVELWANRGYAAIAMDLAGHRPIVGKNAHDSRNRTRLADGGPNQGDREKFGRIDQPHQEQWPYHAVANVIRAHSLLRTLKGVDAERTAVTGISWGGYLTCIVAGVDGRFQAAVPVYGCGYLHENSAWVGRLERMSPTQRQRWINLWDPSRYLPSVTMPIFFVNGTNDFAYPLDSYMKSFDAVLAPKQLRITVNMRHSHQAGWEPQEIGRFIDYHLRKGPPLPALGELKIDNDRVSLAWESTIEVVAASLHFTRDTDKINDRKWVSLPAEVNGQVATVSRPPAGTTAWFLTVQDRLGAIVSSRVILR